MQSQQHLRGEIGDEVAAAVVLELVGDGEIARGAVRLRHEQQRQRNHLVAHAESHGLDYIADSDVRMMAGGGLAPEVRKFVLPYDRLAREQYLDYMRLRRFRQSLLTRAKSSSNFNLITTKVGDMQIAAASTLMLSMNEAVQRGQTRDSVLQGGGPAVNAMLLWLADRFPGTVGMADVVRWRAANAPDDRRSAEALLTEAYVGGVVDLFSQPAALVTTVSARPRASRIARLQAKSRSRIVNLRHESVNLADPSARRLLTLLDGTHDRAALRNEIGAASDSDAASLDAMLQFFAKVSLLVA